MFGPRLHRHETPRTRLGGRVNDDRLLRAPWKAAGAAAAALVGYDLLQRDRAILRNFPIVGHLRYLLEAFGPELRQYIVTSNNEERPFSRDQRRWINASAQGAPNLFAFGTDDEMESVQSLLIIKHSPFPAPAPAAGEVGGAPLFEVPVERCSAAPTEGPGRSGRARS